MERYNAVIGAVTRQEKMKRMVTEGEISSLHRNRKEIFRSDDKRQEFRLPHGTLRE